jgi:Na+-translocating ferredoxin:NAD+ oxidoreductase RnfA subunit
MSLELIDLPCPFLEITGVPCPLCGGTRAFIHASQLQSSFLDYNAVWVFVAIIGVVTGVSALALRKLSPQRYAAARGWLRRTSNLTRVMAVTIVFAIAWAWAIAHSSTIVN